MSKKPAAYLAGSVLLGTAIGAVIGLLTSPVGGRKVRGMVRGKLKGTRELLQEPMKHLPGLAQQTDELRHRLQEGATERLDPLKRKLQGFFAASEAASAPPAETISSSSSQSEGAGRNGSAVDPEEPISR